MYYAVLEHGRGSCQGARWGGGQENALIKEI